MTMVEKSTHQQIADLVNACGGYWELRGIPEPRRKEMRLELEQHLEQAVRDGKSLEEEDHAELANGYGHVAFH